MTREIKFRCWDKTHNEMFFIEDIFRIKNSKFIENCRNGLCEVMQYTGLLDKNGKEIYEGDILQEKIVNQHGTFKKVFAFPDYESFSGGGMDYGIVGVGYSWEDTDPEPENCEIIGNIYENPELLTNNK